MTYLSSNIISIRGVSCGSKFSFHSSISFFMCKNPANLTPTFFSHPSKGVSNDVDQRSTILFVYITIKCNHWHPKWRPPGHQRQQESSERSVLKRSLKLLLKLPLIDFALRKHKKVESFVSRLLQSTVYVIICCSCFFFVNKKQLESLVSVGCDCCCRFQKGNKLLLEFFYFNSRRISVL